MIRCFGHFWPIFCFQIFHAFCPLFVWFLIMLSPIFSLVFSFVSCKATLLIKSLAKKLVGDTHKKEGKNVIRIFRVQQKFFCEFSFPSKPLWVANDGSISPIVTQQKEQKELQRQLQAFIMGNRSKQLNISQL